MTEIVHNLGTKLAPQRESRWGGESDVLPQTMYKRADAMHVYPTSLSPEHVRCRRHLKNKLMGTEGGPLDIPELEEAARLYLTVSCSFEACVLTCRRQRHGPRPDVCSRFCVEIKPRTRKYGLRKEDRFTHIVVGTQWCCRATSAHRLLSPPSQILRRSLPLRGALECQTRLHVQTM